MSVKSHFSYAAASQFNRIGSNLENEYIQNIGAIPEIFGGNSPFLGKSLLRRSPTVLLRLLFDTEFQLQRTLRWLDVTSFHFFMRIFNKIPSLSRSLCLRMSTKKSDEDWKSVLSPEQYRVARLKGTEAPFSGEYYHNKETGEYLCVCCGSKLFESSAKFDSGCGWPSFYQAYGSNGRDDSQTNINRTEDNSLDTKRIEVTCKQC
ncbi:unnamed protein product [Heterobilharzia americana]|nr:unnamed protein product [Heterobilharzia americana]